MSEMKDVTGQKFNRLTAISYDRVTNPSGRKIVYWNCICDCGNIVKIQTQSLREGHQKSCGCLNIEKIVERSTTHGRRHTYVYGIWVAVKQRCTNKNAKNYYNYGGRGITMCEEWVNSFEQFAKDMGEPPTNKHSIERKDNNKGYSPDNCKWATRSEQNNNKRSNVLLTFDGKTMNVSQWANEIGLDHGVIRARLKRGWSVEKTLTTPKMH